MLNTPKKIKDASATEWCRPVRWIGVLAAVAIFSLASAPAHADDIVAATVSNLTFNGNSVCGPSGTSVCSEIINVSFLWDNTTGTAVAGSHPLASSVGPLGTFTFTDPILEPNPQPATYAVLLTATDTNADAFSIVFIPPTSPLTPGAYPLSLSGGLGTLAVSNLSCSSPSVTCRTDFPFGTLAASGAASVASVTPVPEPTSIILLGIGLIGLPGARRKLRLG